MDSQVAKLTAAANALAAIDTPRDAVGVIRLAEAARVFARQAELGGEAENAATAIRLKAEIRLAETVAAGRATGEIASDGRPETIRGADGIPATLRDLGVSPQRLSEARVIAAAFTLPAIDGMAADANERGTTLTRAGVLREARYEANEDFDRLADRLVDPVTRERSAIATFAASLHGAHLAFDAIGRVLTDEEARAPLITLAALQKKLHGKRSTRLEVVS